MGAISNNCPVLYIFYIEYGSWETAPWTPGRISFGKGEKMTNSGNCYACQEVWLDVPETDGRYQISNHRHCGRWDGKSYWARLWKWLLISNCKPVELDAPHQVLAKKVRMRPSEDALPSFVKKPPFIGFFTKRQSFRDAGGFLKAEKAEKRLKNRKFGKTKRMEQKIWNTKKSGLMS